MSLAEFLLAVYAITFVVWAVIFGLTLRNTAHLRETLKSLTEGRQVEHIADFSTQLWKEARVNFEVRLAATEKALEKSDKHRITLITDYEAKLEAKDQEAQALRKEMERMLRQIEAIRDDLSDARLKIVERAIKKKKRAASE